MSTAPDHPPSSAQYRQPVEPVVGQHRAAFRAELAANGQGMAQGASTVIPINANGQLTDVNNKWRRLQLQLRDKDCCWLDLSAENPNHHFS